MYAHESDALHQTNPIRLNQSTSICLSDRCIILGITAEAKLGHGCSVDVSVDGTRHTIEGALEGAQDIGVLPTGLGRRCDEAKGLGRWLEVQWSEARDADGDRSWPLSQPDRSSARIDDAA